MGPVSLPIIKSLCLCNCMLRYAITIYCHGLGRPSRSLRLKWPILFWPRPTPTYTSDTKHITKRRTKLPCLGKTGAMFDLKHPYFSSPLNQAMCWSPWGCADPPASTTAYVGQACRLARADLETLLLWLQQMVPDKIALVYHIKGKWFSRKWEWKKLVLSVWKGNGM